MHDVAVREKQRVNAEQPKPTAAHHTLTNARPPDNTLSSWSGANPSGPWPAQAVSHGDDALKLDQISAIFAHLHSSLSQPAACVHDSSTDHVCRPCGGALCADSSDRSLGLHRGPGPDISSGSLNSSRSGGLCLSGRLQGQHLPLTQLLERVEMLNISGIVASPSMRGLVAAGVPDAQPCVLAL